MAKDKTLNPEMPLVLKNVTKKFGNKTAVANVSLELKSGEVFSLVGPNGSGKTTLIKMIVGLMSPSSGTIEILGLSQPEEVTSIGSHLGYLPDDPSAYDELTGREFLWLVSRLRGMDTATADPRIKELLEVFPLGGQVDELYSNYSRGTKQKFAFLAGILNWPKFVLIDEPIVGLDPDSIDIFKDKIKELAEQGTTIFFATHILDFALDVTDRIGFLVDGKLTKVTQNKKGLKLRSLYKEIVNK